MSLAIACWVRDTALTENERDMAYKKAMLGGVFKSTTTMNTQIKGQKFYNETFNEKHKEEIKRQKNFFGFTKDKTWPVMIETQEITRTICSRL